MEKNREEQGQEQAGRKPVADDSESRLNDQTPASARKKIRTSKRKTRWLLRPAGLQTPISDRACSLYRDVDGLLENYSRVVFRLNG
jgi:hypothetical protein